ncbi:MAG: PmoA family protein [Planctomycetaceae bacterium]
MRHLVLLILSLLLIAPLPASEPVEVEIPAAAWDRRDLPLLVSVPPSLAEAEHLQLTRNGETVPVQWLHREHRLAACIWLKEVPVGESFRGTLRERPEPSTNLPSDGHTSSNSPLQQTTVNVVVTENRETGSIEVTVRGKPVLSYAIELRQPPPKIDAVYAHSGHIHPLRSPAGHILTSEFPADHAHQHGLFGAWVNTSFEGRKVDFWNEGGRTGKVSHHRVIGTTSGDVFGDFTVELRHRDLSSPNGPRDVLTERLTVRVWNTTGPRLVDLMSVQSCATESPLQIREYHYGGRAMRGLENWLGKTGVDVTTSEGKNRVAANHSRPAWVALSGPVDTESNATKSATNEESSPTRAEFRAGLAMMGHPTNIRYPEPVRIHPDKPYFVFTPCVLGPFEISPKTPFVSRYRCVTFDGTADPKLLDRYSQSYAEFSSDKLPNNSHNNGSTDQAVR